MTIKQQGYRGAAPTDSGALRPAPYPYPKKTAPPLQGGARPA